MKFYFTLFQNGGNTKLAYKMKNIDSVSLGSAIEEFGNAHNLMFFDIKEINNVKHVFYKHKETGDIIEYEVNAVS